MRRYTVFAKRDEGWFNGLVVVVSEASKCEFLEIFGAKLALGNFRA
jgi:hypothetical protein